MSYLGFSVGLEEPVEVDWLSGKLPFSSSKCTAVENRFQNAGSRTPAMARLVIEEKIMSFDNYLTLSRVSEGAGVQLEDRASLLLKQSERVDDAKALNE